MIRARTAGFRKLAAEAHSASVPLRILISNDAGSGYSDAQINRIVLACAIMAMRVALEYGIALPIVQFLPQGAAKPEAMPGVVDAWLHIVAKIPGDPSAQGWHSVDEATGLPDGYISTQGIDIDGLSECIGHEIGETQRDPNVDQTVTLADGATWPVEISDAVQANDNGQRVPVELNDGQPPVMCANFVLAAYWDPAIPKGTKCDYLGVLTGPIPAIGPYGYSAVTEADGTTRDVFGEKRTALPDDKTDPECRYQLCKSALGHARKAL